MTGRVVEGQPEITIEIYSEGNIGEVQCEVDLTKPETIDQLEQIAKERLQQIVKHTLIIVQKTYNSIFLVRGYNKTLKPERLGSGQGRLGTLIPRNCRPCENGFPNSQSGNVTNSILQQMKE